MAKRVTGFVFYLSGLLCLLSIGTNAQDSSYKVTMPVYVQANFFYDFPQSFGVSAGIDFPIKSKLITKIDSGGTTKSKYRDLIVSANLGFYRYEFNHTGFFFFPAIGKRYNKGRPYFFEWLISMGVLRTFYDGQVYRVDDNGNVSKLKDYGRVYAETGFAAVFGHDFERNKKPKPFAADIKPSLWFQYPYNSFLLPHFSIELEFKYHFNNMDRLVRQKNY